MPGQSGAPGKEGLIGPKVQGLLIMDMMGVGSGRTKEVTIDSRKTVALGDRVWLFLRFQERLGSQQRVRMKG